MGAIYKPKIDWHPNTYEGKEAIRRNYIKLLRELAGTLEDDDEVALPVTILAKMEQSATSDYATLILVCFGNRLELQYIDRFLDNRLNV